MRRTLTILGLAAAATLSVAAAPSPVSPAFGNTIVSTYPDGRTAHLWLQADGGYTGQGRRHDPSSGHWTVKGGKLCLRQSRPFPAPFSYCTPLPAGGFETAWSGKAFTGEAISISLARGHLAGG